MFVNPLILWCKYVISKKSEGINLTFRQWLFLMTSLRVNRCFPIDPIAISGAEQLVRESLATIAAQTANSAAFNVKDLWQIYIDQI